MEEQQVKAIIKEVYDSSFKEVKEVANVITDYFGEPLVDVQYPKLETFFDDYEEWVKDKNDIERNDEDYLRLHIKNSIKYSFTIVLIRFPKVTVTNEDGDSVDITELYAKIRLNYNGTAGGTFQLIRTEYPVDQYVSGYCHSHVAGVSTSFQTPCLGTGPIRTTIDRLTREADLDLWGLFCFELSKYVQVESLKGGPHRRLTNIGFKGGAKIVHHLQWTTITFNMQEFLEDFLKEEPIKIAYTNGCYTLGEPIQDLWVRMSNAFIKWCNDRPDDPMLNFVMLQGNSIVKYGVNYNQIYSYSNFFDYSKARQAQGTPLFKFKGEQQHLNITVFNGNNSPKGIFLIHAGMFSSIITRILDVINLTYGRNLTGKKVKLL